jgi:hypothetical protein
MTNRELTLSTLSGLIDRLRLYSHDAFQDLFTALDEIEKKHNLIPRLTDAEEAEADRIEAMLDRGEIAPELDVEAARPLDDWLETDESILARLQALPERERDTIFGIIEQCVEIDKPAFKMTPALMASIRVALKDPVMYTEEEARQKLRDAGIPWGEDLPSR